MADYIVLIDYTDQGIRTIKESPGRADAFRENAKKIGVTVKELYWTSGAHDGVLIVEAPDDKAVSALMLSLVRAGNVRTQTLRAYGPSEMREILDATP
jgi:uncharacterized protein with GYD domain